MESRHQSAQNPSELRIGPRTDPERLDPPGPPRITQGDGDPKFDRTVMVRLDRGDEVVVISRTAVSFLHLGGSSVVEPLSPTLTGRFVRLTSPQHEAETVRINTIVKFFLPDRAVPSFTAQLCNDWLFDGGGEKVAFVLDDGQIYQVDAQALDPKVAELVRRAPLGTVMLRMTSDGQPPQQDIPAAKLGNLVTPPLAGPECSAARLAAGIIEIMGKRTALTNDDLMSLGGYIANLADLEPTYQAGAPIRYLMEKTVELGRNYLSSVARHQEVVAGGALLNESDWSALMDTTRQLRNAAAEAFVTVSRRLVSRAAPEQRVE